MKSSKPKITMLDRALRLASKGYFVLPLQPRGKQPLGLLVPHGFKDATRDPKLIRSWWSRFPDANIGIVTGAVSGICVLDIDPRNGGNRTFLELEKQAGAELKSATRVETGGGGWHFYYSYQVGLGLKNVADANGIDFKTDGGYVVASGSLHESGRRYRLLAKRFPRPSELAPLPPALVARLEKRPKRIIRKRSFPPSLYKVSPGERNNHLFLEASRMRKEGLEGSELCQRLLEINRSECQPPLDDDEVSKIAESASKYTSYELTPGGNAKRFADEFREKLRYCHQTTRWYAWDGKRWHLDDGSGVGDRIKQFIKALFLEARRNADDADQAKLKNAKSADTKHGHQSIADLAKSYLSVAPGELDPDPYLFNCFNGTIDLRKGKLRPHNPKDFITKLSPVRYREHSKSLKWIRFLESVSGGDEGLVAFLKRACGYSLSGLISEEKLLLVHGPGASGKSTFIEAIKQVMGDYAMTADFETFLQRKTTGGPRNDIARLDGARFVASIEVDANQRLAEALVKQVTGGDTLTARYLFKEAFEFKPRFKLWLVANDAPKVRHSDTAMWRRIHLVPFVRPIPVKQQDPAVKRLLTGGSRKAMEAVLVWAVDGFLEWQKRGLKPPPIVQAATSKYRESMNPLREWIKQECRTGADKYETPMALWNNYNEWAKDNKSGDDRLSRSEFWKELDKCGYKVIGKRIGRGSSPRKVRIGLELRT